jgi:hypothetical protein
MTATDRAADVPTLASTSDARPWTAPEDRIEEELCRWCGRTVYHPALPCCRIAPTALFAMLAEPGASARCVWEARTRGVTPALF